MFRKVWFANETECTAGLILESDKLGAILAKDGIPGVSRLFPMSEATKMLTLHVSREFSSWDDAFKYETHVKRGAQ